LLAADGNLRKLVLPQGNVHKVITVSKSTLSDVSNSESKTSAGILRRFVVPLACFNVHPKFHNSIKIFFFFEAKLLQSHQV